MCTFELFSNLIFCFQRATVAAANKRPCACVSNPPSHDITTHLKSTPKKCFFLSFLRVFLRAPIFQHWWLKILQVLKQLESANRAENKSMQVIELIRDHCRSCDLPPTLHLHELLLVQFLSGSSSSFHRTDQVSTEPSLHLADSFIGARRNMKFVGSS